MAAVVFFSLALLFLLWLIAQPWLTERKRKRIRARPFPAEWRDILKRRVPYVRLMPADLQLQLKSHVQVFLAEKAFIGCDELQITDEIRVTIAAQACLLILNRGSFYYPELRQILVYPGSFVVKREHTDGAGIKHAGRQVLAGESWSNGQVVLSWYDTLEGAAVPDDGNNVVIHEFAHQLDQEKGAANGAPLLARRAHYRRWSQVLNDEYRALQARIRFRHEPVRYAGIEGTGQAQEQTPQVPLFSDYGATDPAEFFAVISEVFFERPARMAQEHSALYQELVRFYRLDPLSWR
jgi:MtfA peptidase